MSMNFSALHGLLFLISTKRNGYEIYNEMTCGSENLWLVLSKQTTSGNTREPMKWSENV